ncbi:MAG: sulfotransferase domain-containing protein [Candidatus Binatia bacterium]
MKRLVNPQRLPPFLKGVAKAPRVLTAGIRLLPDFLIIGAQRCGTTSLQRYLIQHPCIAPSFRKEVHFFDRNLKKGVNWYRAHFPSAPHKYYVTTILRRRFLTGEASAAYLFYPHAPKRILETVPRAKLIVLLRNPVDRAYSQYQHEASLRYETLPFEAAIEQEPRRLEGEREKMLCDEGYDSYSYRHHSYLSRGVYADQLAIWMNLFSREQMLILQSEDFFAGPASVFQKVLRFLDLPPWELANFKRYNAREYSTMDGATRRRLIEYFEPHNRRLSELVGRNFSWD